jgi:hypothetical protein
MPGSGPTGGGQNWLQGMAQGASQGWNGGGGGQQGQSGQPANPFQAGLQGAAQGWNQAGQQMQQQAAMNRLATNPFGKQIHKMLSKLMGPQAGQQFVGPVQAGGDNAFSGEEAAQNSGNGQSSSPGF